MSVTIFLIVGDKRQKSYELVAETIETMRNDIRSANALLLLFKGTDDEIDDSLDHMIKNGLVSLI